MADKRTITEQIIEQIMESSLGAFWRDSEEDVSAMIDAMEIAEEAEDEDVGEIDNH